MKSGKGIVKRITLFTSMIPLLFILNSANIKQDRTSIYRSNLKVYKRRIEYSKGTIYIGDEKYLESIHDLEPGDVLALDERNAEDPDIKIYDSYKYHDADQREEIIEGLLLYEETYPSNWERSRIALNREWGAHNAMHFFGININRTTDVDFNNKDEDTYRLSYYLNPFRY